MEFLFFTFTGKFVLSMVRRFESDASPVLAQKKSAMV